MKWTRVANLKLWLAFMSLQACVIYALLVVGDFVLYRTLALEARRIQEKRVIEEDEPQRKAAIANGFKPMLYPDAIDKYEPLRTLSMKLGVAPLAPQPNSRLYHCNDGYGLTTYTSDRFGFRNPDYLWDEKKIDFVLIGDSFTQGACVWEKDTISSNLLQKAKGLNLGTGSNHPVHYAALVKTFVPHIKPPKVVIIFYANDNDEGDETSVYYDRYFIHEAEYFDSTSDGKMTVSQGLINYYVESEPIIRSLLTGNSLGFFERGNLFTRAKKYLALSTIRTHVRALAYKRGLNQKLPFSSKLAIDTLISVCADSGCEPILVYIPNSEFWSPDSRSKAYAGLLSGYAAEKRTLFLDMTEYLAPLGDDAYARKGHHLSPRGYRVVADKIAQQLAK